LAGFAARGGFEDDGHCTARAWLKWQTQVTTGAAAGAVGWVGRLAAHPVIARSLAAGGLSPSWAREICDWTSRLPDDRRGDGDGARAAAARGGASLAALAGVAQEMYERSCRDGGPGCGGPGCGGPGCGGPGCGGPGCGGPGCGGPGCDGPGQRDDGFE